MPLGSLLHDRFLRLLSQQGGAALDWAALGGLATQCRRTGPRRAGSTAGMTVAAGVSTGRANFGRRNYTFVYMATRALRRVLRVMAQPLRPSDPP